MATPIHSSDSSASPASTTLERIWEPLAIGPCSVKHRIMVSGHTQLYGRDGTLSEQHIDYYRERARGGAALLILEQQGVHPAVRNYHAGCGAWERRVIPWYERLAAAAHEFGCKQFVQLFASGAQGSGTQYLDAWQPIWSASGIPSAISNEKPLAMERDHIDELVQHFGICAQNAQLAGLDGVEIHAAHSQLVGEFLSPAFNKREDRYGGSTRERCQLLLEIGEEIRRQVGDSIAVGVRLSFDEYLGSTGITAEEATAQIELLAETALFDFFDISGGGYHTLHIAVAPMGRMPEGFLAPAAKRAKAIVGDRAAVFVVGRILDLAKAEAILRDGAADMVAMTRAHIAEPAIVRKTLEGRQREITRCVGANVCLRRLIENRPVICLMNPATGRERELGEGTLRPVPAAGRKRILVVGGGPAGMKVAGVAARRGHRVSLWEASAELGGHLNALRRLPSREGWQVAIDNLLRPLEDAGVEIARGREADAADVVAGEYDAVVCATGARWDPRGYSAYRPDRSAIPGWDLACVSEIGSALEATSEDPRALGDRVLLVDETETYLPLGLAERLAAAGVAVEVISPRPLVGGETLRTLEMPHLFPRLRELGVRWRAAHFVESFEPGRALVYNLFGGPPEAVAIDHAVLSLFREPRAGLFQALEGQHPDPHRVGDALVPRKLEAVIYEAERLGREL